MASWVNRIFELPNECSLGVYRLFTDGFTSKHLQLWNALDGKSCSEAAHQADPTNREIAKELQVCLDRSSGDGYELRYDDRSLGLDILDIACLSFSGEQKEGQVCIMYVFSSVNG